VDPRLARALVAWLIARDERLGGRVRPNFEQPGTTGPFVVYTHVSTVRVGNMERRTGETATRVQIDVWGRVDADVKDIADTICGDGDGADPTARGLDYFAGEWPDPADAENPVVVQFCERVDGGDSDDAATPTGGTEEGWYRASADYRITYERV
jgi:hypothetical protein